MYLFGVKGYTPCNIILLLLKARALLRDRSPAQRDDDSKEEALSHIIPDQIDHLVSDVDVQGQLVMVAGDVGCLY